MTPAVISVHYHLRPGGVTRVIEATDRILRAAGVPHLVLAGGRDGLPGLGYDKHRGGDLSGCLLRAAREAIGGRARLWHFHNPCLGKNPALTRSLIRLAEAGEAMILQHHDLAEDGRPENLAVLHGIPYPDSPRIVHAFLNHRDRGAFLRGGLDPGRTVLLPNPRPARSEPLIPPGPPEGPPLVLLPMRGLPRKNLGEMLLLAAASPMGTRFAQGSAPEQPEWQRDYQAWRDFSENLSLPVTFDVFADDLPDNWLDRSTHLLTTSTREGFGMIHLEAAGRRRVLGRHLAYLDLRGFPRDGLYEALWVHGRDFADFADETQRQHIQAFREGFIEVSVEHADGPTPLRDWLRQQLSSRQPADASQAIARHSGNAHLRRLLELRDQLLAAPPSPLRHLDREAIRSAFLPAHQC